MNRLKNFVKSHPLLTVMFAAVLVRLAAVIWSQGFIHSDDHFDTLSVAWSWCQDGLWGADGWLRWKQKLSDTIGRFPLYNLFLLFQMKACQWVGISSFSDMMYVIRGSHALISLLPVWAAYKIVQLTTKSVRWSVAAGLIMSLHFALPFIGVRNLIEAVGGSLWLMAVWYLCRFMDDRRVAGLYLAGLWAGLAWMIRFQIAFAILPIPFLLWWGTRRVRPAIHFCAAIGIMLLASGFTDLLLLGRFGGSTITNLTMNTGLGSLYHTIPLLYVVLLLLFLVPPISFCLPFLILRPSFIRTQTILFWTSISFLVFHSLHSNQQERFIFPIVPAFVVLGTLAIWSYVESRTPVRFPRWLKTTLWISVGVNLVLGAFFTFAYGHRGMIEPLLWFEKNAPTAHVLFLQPEVKRWVPIEYGGPGIQHDYVRSWEELSKWPVDRSSSSGLDYFVVYPKSDDELPRYLDSLSIRFGPLDQVFKVEPSYYDQTLHLLNPASQRQFRRVCLPPAPGRDPDRKTNRPVTLSYWPANSYVDGSQL